jgi:hypothetical protein
MGDSSTVYSVSAPSLKLRQILVILLLTFGWHGVFLTLAGVCALSAFSAGYL